MSQLLFEIGVEELPALFIEPALEFMESFFKESLAEHGLKCGRISTYGTPRRLVLTVSDLDEKQEDLCQEVLGPNVAIALLDDGSLSKAGLGFIKSKGLVESDIYQKQTKKGQVIAGKIQVKGQESREILPKLLLQLMHKIPFKKRMRWDSSGDTFARPVRWILAVLDGVALDIEFADIKSGDTSRGHRFLTPEEFKVESIAQYLSEIAKRKVMLSHSERAKLIVKQAQEKVAQVGGVFRQDDELLNTVKNLVEYPFIILGKFEDKYLKVPQEVLISEMRAHQKCFAVYDGSGKLMPYFICVAGTKPHDEAFFSAGNARVLRARFEDGAFYFAKDKEKTLEQHAEALSNQVFEKELGSLSQKSERIKNTALSLVKVLRLSEQETGLIKRVAPVIKADLVCGVVGEFPELQGVMGSIYAKIQGHSQEYCDAIWEHYLPRSANDELPTSKVSAALSIADKLDTLVGIIGINKQPKGNKDPFGLRRAAIGVVRMIISFGIRVELRDLVALSINSYGKMFVSTEQKLNTTCCDFIVQRARGLLLDKLKSDSKQNAASFADSVLAVGSSDLLDAFARADALFYVHNKNKLEFESLTQTFKRAGNIVKKAQESGTTISHDGFNADLLTSSYEKDLIVIVDKTKSLVASVDDFSGTYEELCESHKRIFAAVTLIKPKLDAFFDNVMVMDKDEQVRNARLSLLCEIKKISDKVADFTHL